MITFRTKCKPYLTRRLTLRQKEPQKATLDSIAKSVDQLLRTPLSKISYKWIKRLSTLNPNKRDGAIVSCQVNENGDFIVNQDTIINNCLNELILLS